MEDIYRKVIEAEGWVFNSHTNALEKRVPVPDGELFWFSIGPDEVVDSVRKSYILFSEGVYINARIEKSEWDVDYAAKLRKLQEAAQAITEMLKSLYGALASAEMNQQAEKLKQVARRALALRPNEEFFFSVIRDEPITHGVHCVSMEPLDIELLVFSSAGGVNTFLFDKQDRFNDNDAETALATQIGDRFGVRVMLDCDEEKGS